jgi:phosphoribosylformylglycinamidine synthase I
MKFGVIVFPGSNCDHDAWFTPSTTTWAIPRNSSGTIRPTLGDMDAVILPGGFAYGDYLRCGAIAKFSPVMAAVRKFAADGGLVLGICNGFQILVEAGLLPGALMRNRGSEIHLPRSAAAHRDAGLALHQRRRKGQILRMPIAHGEGCYFADQRTLDELEAEDRVLFRYLDNPNGSLRDIAGILNASAT